MKRRLQLVFVLAINISILLLVGCAGKERTIVFSEDASPISISESSISEDNIDIDDSTVFVHISGAVDNPGVYELESGSRLYDAIMLAGGFRDDACEDYCNLALILEDANQYYIPTMDEAITLSQEDSEQTTSHYDGEGRLDINVATLDELKGLSGIGQARAQAIIDYRQEQGAFGSIEDIKNVSGIKDALFSQIKDYIVVR